MALLSLLISILSISPILILIAFSYLFYKKNRPLEAMIFFATIIHEVMLVSLPCIYAVFSDFKYEHELRSTVDEYDLLRVLIIENIYIICFLLPFLFFLKLFKRPLISFQLSTVKLYNFLAVLTFIGIVVYCFQVIHRPSIEEIVDSYSSSGTAASSNVLVSLFNTTFEYTSIICATLLAIKSRDEKYPRYFQYMGLLMLVCVVLVVIVSGVRGRIFWLADFILIVCILKKRYKPLFVMGILMLVFIPLNSILVTQIRPISEEIAKEGGLTNAALLNIGETLIKGINEPQKEESPGILETFAERAQGPRNSVALIKQYDLGQMPGLNIYAGAFLYFLPRSVYNRPVIGSPDTDFKNAGIFKVMDLNYGIGVLSMGPLLASAHAYWEGGYFGVVIISILCSLMWILLLRIAYNQHLLFGILLCLLGCCALLIDGFLTALTPFYAVIAIFWKNFLPLFLAYFLFKRIKFPMFKII